MTHPDPHQHDVPRPAADEPKHEPPATDWVNPEPFRTHVRDLICETGLPWRLIAAHAGVSPRALTTLLHGRRGHRPQRLHVSIARALAATSVESIRTDAHESTDIRPLRLLLAELRALGWTTTELRHHLDAADLAQFDDRTTWLCSRTTAARLTALYDLATSARSGRPGDSRPAPQPDHVVCGQHHPRLDRKRATWSTDYSSPVTARSS